MNKNIIKIIATLYTLITLTGIAKATDVNCSYTDNDCDQQIPEHTIKTYTNATGDRVTINITDNKPELTTITVRSNTNGTIKTYVPAGETNTSTTEKDMFINTSTDGTRTFYVLDTESQIDSVPEREENGIPESDPAEVYRHNINPASVYNHQPDTTQEPKQNISSNSKTNRTETLLK